MSNSNDISVLRNVVSLLLLRIDRLESVVSIISAENIELKTDNTALKSENTILKSDISTLKLENTELKARLNQNSNNSHKPPSSDGLQKKPGLPSNSIKKTGGQFGHQGKTLKMVETPDQIIVHHIESCPCCQKVFSASDVEQTIQKRQVFDIPEPKLEVTEHQIGIISCCGQQFKGTFPDAVTQPVQYGSKIKALSVLLNVDYKIPFEKIEQLLGDIYNCSFNESTAISANLRCYNDLESTELVIKKAVLKSHVVHFDETGMRVEAKLHWFHTASTTFYTYLFVHQRRGKEALNSTYSLLPDFKNWAVHDCWKSYFEFKDCTHALCNAHILRELEALRENGSLWAVEMKQLLLDLYNLSEKATLIVHDKQLWIDKYLLICKNADEEEPKPIQNPNKRGKVKNSKGRNLLNRLVEHLNGILAFAFIETIPFTNNQAERDIRCLKTKQKVATSFRTFDGAKHYARIQSFVSTCRKQQMSVFQNLINIFEHKQVVFLHA